MSNGRGESYVWKAAHCTEIRETLDIIKEGFNHYSVQLSDFVAAVPSNDHPLVYSLLRSYADALERHHPGTKLIAEMTDEMFATNEICIRVPETND